MINGTLKSKTVDELFADDDDDNAYDSNNIFKFNRQQWNSDVLK